LKQIDIYYMHIDIYMKNINRHCLFVLYIHMQGSEASGLEANRHVLHAYRYLYEINRHGMFVYIRMQNSILITCHMRRRIHA